MNKDERPKDEADTEWKLGFAAGYMAALAGKPNPNIRGVGSERRTHKGDDFKHGYKAGYDQAVKHMERGVKVQTKADWDTSGEGA